jgi:hypothetical protein
MPAHTSSANAARRVKAGNRQSLLWREDRKAIGLRAAGRVVRVDRVRNRLEAEEVCLVRRRIDDVDRKRGLGSNLERKFPIWPMDRRASVQIEKGVVDPAVRQAPGFGEIPIGARGDMGLARRQVVARFRHQSLCSGLQERLGVLTIHG